MSGAASTSALPRRLALLPRLGLRPTAAELLGGYLDEALPAGARAVALDAGCGRMSALATRKDRLARLVGVDIH
ncbi:MAG TPA: hypothetical protein VK592_08325, partial [Candidatus Dormibacteraeota bacterium]|nr:hypothetical protein [Candidatus Dormibacteraeota bacterium]